MPVVYRKGLLEGPRVTLVPPAAIAPNPDQPRRYFDPEGLAELADSIRVHGILQPLSVRRKGGGRYELIAGERRLRAAVLCGLQEVPCLVMDVDRPDACLLSLIENLQRRDLDFWEEAEALSRLISLYGLSQEQAAEKLGKSQSGVANKLRLLRLSEEVRRVIRENGLSERHARALLRLADPEDQRRTAEAAAKGGWNVARTEAYVEELVRRNQTVPARRRTTYVIKDVRLFLNSLDRGVRMMRQAGVGASWERTDGDGGIVVTVRIPLPERRGT